MGKRIILTLWVVLATFSVLLGHIMPHHHHHDETVICVADDVHKTEKKDCCSDCEHKKDTPDGSCCGIKSNLISHFNDSRKEGFQCDCDSSFHFHGGDHYILISFLGWDLFLSDKLPDKVHIYTPYTCLYHSVLTEGHVGLRAPPVA